MLKTFFGDLPFLQSFIKDTLNKYVGIEVNTSSFSIDENNNLSILISNIEANTSKINSLYLKSSFIKIARANIKKLEIKINFNEFNVILEGVNILVMPIIEEVKKEKLSIENVNNINNKSNDKKDNIKDNIEKTEDENNMESKNKQKESFLDSFLKKLINKLNINLSDINVYILNYESKKMNITYLNPCLSLHLTEIKYEKNNEDENNINNNNNNNNVNTYIENKHLYINNILIMINKEFNINKFCEIISSEEKTSPSIYNNNTIFSFNKNKNINLFVDKNRNLYGSFGDIQIIINMLQLELLKNFIETFTEYKEIHERMHKKYNLINNDNNCKDNCKDNVDSQNKPPTEQIITSSKINLNSFSIIVLEDTINLPNHNIIKINCYNPNEIYNHFCYYESNYFVFFVNSLSFTLEKLNSIEINLTSIFLDYIEFTSKSEKKIVNNDINQSSDVYSSCSSKYSDVKEKIIYEDDVFGSVHESIDDNMEKFNEVLGYDFVFTKNEIIVLGGMKVNYNKSKESQQKISLSIANISLNFHPIFLFKSLKLIHDQLEMVKYIIFFNLNKREEWFNKKILEKDFAENLDNINIGLSTIGREVSNISIVEDITENQDISNNFILKEKLYSNNKNVINNSTSNSPLNNIELNLNINEIEIRVYSFKKDNKFTSTKTPFFSEFYYENIYTLEIEGQYNKKHLTIEEITDKNHICLKFGKISGNLKSSTIFITSDKINLFLNKKRIIEIKKGISSKYSFEKNEISINFSLASSINLPSLMAVSTIGDTLAYSFNIYTIFGKRMIINEKKIFRELMEMYVGQNTKKKKKIKDNNLEDEKIVNSPPLNFMLTIPEIILKLDITDEITPLFIISNLTLNFEEINKNSSRLKISLDNLKSQIEFQINYISVSLEMKKNEYICKEVESGSINNVSEEEEFEKILPDLNLVTYLSRIEELNNQILIENETNLSPKNQLELQLSFSIENITFNGIEFILYLNDIYNALTKEKLLSEIPQPIKKEEIKENENNQKSDIDLLCKSMISMNKQNKKKIKKYIIEFKFVLKEFKIEIIDKSDKKIFIKILTLKAENNGASFESIKAGISYSAGKGQVLTADIMSIDNFGLRIRENNKILNYELSLDIINIEFCKDSLNLIENLAGFLNKILSESFISPDKNNNIILSSTILNIKQKHDENFYMRDFCSYSNYKKNTKKEKPKDLNISEDLISEHSIDFSSEGQLDIIQDYMESYYKENVQNGNNISNSMKFVSEDEDSKTFNKEEIIFEKKNNSNSSRLNFELGKIEIKLYGGRDLISQVKYMEKIIDSEEDAMILEKVNSNNENEGVDFLKEYENLGENDEEYKKKTEEKIKKYNVENELKSTKPSEIPKEKKEEEDNEKNQKKNIEASKFDFIELGDGTKKTGRDTDNYIELLLNKISFEMVYLKEKSYDIEFKINKIEIIDSLQMSSFKRILTKKILFEEDEESLSTKTRNLSKLKNILSSSNQDLSIFVDISSVSENSQNSADYNIIFEINLVPLDVMIHQSSLNFILTFISNTDKNDDIKDNKGTPGNINNDLFYFVSLHKHTDKTFVEDITFNNVIIEDEVENIEEKEDIEKISKNLSSIRSIKDDSVEEKENQNKFVFIRKFYMNDIYIFLTYESKNYSLFYNEIKLPLLPSVDNYQLYIKNMSYKGYVTINKFIEILSDNILNQLSKYKLIVDFFKSLSWTKPFFEICLDFFDIFISPITAYRNNKSIVKGFTKGVKKFVFNLLGKNLYLGEKVIRTLTTFIGVTKSNNIGTDSLYGKIMLGEKEKKLYDYFYK